MFSIAWLVLMSLTVANCSIALIVFRAYYYHSVKIFCCWSVCVHFMYLIQCSCFDPSGWPSYSFFKFYKKCCFCAKITEFQYESMYWSETNQINTVYCYPSLSIHFFIQDGVINMWICNWLSCNDNDILWSKSELWSNNLVLGTVVFTAHISNTDIWGRP